jgi:hypothetical protein
MKIIFAVLIIQTFACFAAAENQNYLVRYSETVNGEEMEGYKTQDGQIVIKAKYGIAIPDKMYGIAFVISDGQWVCIDRKENVILYPFIYDNGPDYIVEGLFRFVENNKIGFADSDANIIIPAEFDFADYFREGLSKFAYGGYKEYDDTKEHWIWTGEEEIGYINKFGQKFTRIINTEDNRRIAWIKDGKHYYIDKDAKIIKEAEIFKEKED